MEEDWSGSLASRDFSEKEMDLISECLDESNEEDNYLGEMDIAGGGRPPVPGFGGPP